jgi:hypothetical protein
MKIFAHLLPLAVAVFVLLPTSASAQSLRCKNETVNVGDMRVAVLQRCGEPVAKDSYCKPVDPQSVQRNASGSNVVVVLPCQNVDQWTYNPGYGQFMTTLQFEGEKVTAIKYGDRVK